MNIYISHNEAKYRIKIWYLNGEKQIAWISC
jgi:hypothetical protein